MATCLVNMPASLWCRNRSDWHLSSCQREINFAISRLIVVDDCLKLQSLASSPVILARQQPSSNQKPCNGKPKSGTTEIAKKTWKMFGSLTTAYQGTSFGFLVDLCHCGCLAALAINHNKACADMPHKLAGCAQIPHWTLQLDAFELQSPGKQFINQVLRVLPGFLCKSQLCCSDEMLVVVSWHDLHTPNKKLSPKSIMDHINDTNCLHRLLSLHLLSYHGNEGLEQRKTNIYSHSGVGL